MMQPKGWRFNPSILKKDKVVNTTNNITLINCDVFFTKVMS